MGLFGDWIRAEIYGHQVREAIKEIKNKEDESKICGHCGRIITGEGAICKSTHWSLSDKRPDLLCKKCMKECKRCGKIFCQKHKSKHSC